MNPPLTSIFPQLLLRILQHRQSPCFSSSSLIRRSNNFIKFLIMTVKFHHKE